ncbi:MAG: type I restriction enzyme HsdR N-terminal domain-containing protein [Acidimicrobiia bacterium]
MADLEPGVPTTPVVVEVADEKPIIAAPKTAPRSAPKWETDARDRVRVAIRRFSKPLADLVARDANEGDTRLLVTDLLCDALGYDKYEDLTTEYQVKGEFADYGIRLDKQLVAFIECKRSATKLGAKHLRQVQQYAVNEGVEWVWLTNGAVWQVYHIEGVLPLVVDLALQVDLLNDPPAQAAQGLFYISKVALRRKLIDNLWQEKRAKSPKSLARALLSEPVAEAIRKELRRSTSQNIAPSEISRLLRETVVRPDCLS